MSWKRLLCWWDRLTFYLDPRVWGIKYDGHIRDVSWYRVEGNRELEFSRCVRCRVKLDEGWRSMP